MLNFPLKFIFTQLETMSIDSAWIFRICLLTAVILILFADALGYGGANARKNDENNDGNDKGMKSAKKIFRCNWM